MKTPRSRVRLLAAFVAALGTIACSGTSVGADSPYIPVSGSAWRLALGDVNGDGNKELLCGLYHAALSCVNSTTGETLWERPLGGFPFAVAAADTNGDGKAESFAACADGKLYAFAHDGQPLWTYSPNTAAKYSVVVCRRGRGQAPLLA
jgi:outer membrane protein assembly factor BamB